MSAHYATPSEIEAWKKSRPQRIRPEVLAKLREKLKRDGVANAGSFDSCASVDVAGDNSRGSEETVSIATIPIGRTTPAHAAQMPVSITRPGISASRLAIAGIRHVAEREAYDLIGLSGEGLAIPYRDKDGNAIIGRNGRPYYRVRLANPRGSAKYLSAPSSGCELYIPPGLNDIAAKGCTLGVVEGEFKAISLVESGFPCVGIGGISSMAPNNANGEPELLPRLRTLIEAVQPSSLAFIGDSDTSLIADFSREAIKLVHLTDVAVVLPRIPLDAQGKGPDDLREQLKGGFSEYWTELLQSAERVQQGTTQTQLMLRLLRREKDSGAFSHLGAAALDKAKERLVKIGALLENEPLAYASLEEIAADCAGLARATFRAAVKLTKDRPTICADTASTVAGIPSLVLPGNDFPITDAAEQIFAIIGPTHTMFSRGGKVHEIEREGKGVTRLKRVTPVQFRSRLEQYGKVFAWRSGKDSESVLKPTICPEDTAHALLESAPALTLPKIVTLSSCPVLTEKDSAAATLNAGWHDVGGGLYVCGGDVPPIVDLGDAIQALGALLYDFDFASQGDRSRALASLISPALRFGNWLHGHLPIDIGEADSSQSGKTYRQKLVAAVYNEVPSIVVRRAGGVGSLDESISQRLIDGRPFVLLDNLRGKLDSEMLEAAITAPGSVSARVPHRGEVSIDPRGFVFQITSNGLETTRDLANRSSVVRIRKRPDGYAFRRFQEGDLYAHVVKNQPYYLGCVFSVVEEWAKKGKPRTSESRHDFREWAQTLDWIVQFVMGEAPLLDHHHEARHRISDPRAAWLRSLCISLRDADVREWVPAIRLAEFVIEHDIPPPNIKTGADEMSVARAIGRIMAAKFGDSSVIDVDGFSLRKQERYSQQSEKNCTFYRICDKGAQGECPANPANPANRTSEPGK